MRIGDLLSRRRNAETASCPDGAYSFRSAEALLTPHQDRIDRIRKQLGLPEAHWQHFYTGLFERYARFCQLLPASEAHHHAEPGGLLRHGLETVEYALELRAGKLLPPGAPPEEITLYQEAWTWGVATGALLHDIGKPVADIELIPLEGDTPWDPWQHLFPDESGARCYRIRYLAERSYRLHERLGLLLAERLLPPRGLSWIASHRQLFSEWTALLAGDHENAPTLAELVLSAEQRSVAEDLGNARPRAVTGSRTRPLAERLATALRHLVDEGELPINRDGAAAWATEDSLWLVSKRGLDAIREHMNREGQTGVPGRNDRLMDELQQHGWLVPQGDRAIWKARVFADDWPKAHELSFLRFPIERLWPNPETRPAPFAGRIDPLVDTEPSQPEPPAQSGPGPEQTASGHDPESTTPEVSAPQNEDVLSSAAERESSETQPADETGEQSPTPSPAHEVEDDAPNTSSPSEPSTEQDDAASAPDTGADIDPGQAFLDWLRAGLRERRFQVNNANARIHRVPEGLLLVSPGIFKDFDRERWSKAQKRFQKLRINRKAPDGTNIWSYSVQGGKRVLKGFLIEDLEAVFPGISLPAPNPHLTLIPAEGEDPS